MQVSAIATVQSLRNMNDDEAPKETRDYKGGPPDTHEETGTVLITWPPRPNTEHEFDERMKKNDSIIL